MTDKTMTKMERNCHYSKRGRLCKNKAIIVCTIVDFGSATVNEFGEMVPATYFIFSCCKTHMMLQLRKLALPRFSLKRLHQCATHFLVRAKREEPSMKAPPRA